MEATMNRRDFLKTSVAGLSAFVPSCTARAHAFISGTVQGVSYRASTQDQARQRGVVGWVRNLQDGRVEAVMQGTKDKVDDLLQWCRKGPPAAKVEKVVVSWEDVGDEFTTFDVRY